MYLEIKININPDFSEILMAELITFDSFQETDYGVDAYILKTEYSENLLTDVLEKYNGVFDFSFKVSEMEEKNWNEEWEKNFTHTTVDEDVMIRASFHPFDPSYKYEIVIDPQISFGTGHHDTTAGVIRHMLKMDYSEKKVLDAGTGTGILAIMAEKLGSDYIYAYDIDQWSYNNCLDNFALNNSQKIEIAQGDVSLCEKFSKEFDIVIANINKNVLLEDIPHFQKYLKKNGYLVLSGFYENDIKDMLQCCHKYDLHIVDQSVSENNWAVLVLKMK